MIGQTTAHVQLALKNSNGLDLIRRMKDRHETVRILVWSMYPENLYAERALRAGAQGYLNKGQATLHVLDAIRAILQGRVYVSGEFADQLLHRVVCRNPEDTSGIDNLSLAFGMDISTIYIVNASIYAAWRTGERFGSP